MAAQQILRDLLEGQLIGRFAAPIGQPGTDRLGVFIAGHVVAAGATIFADRPAADVNQLLVDRAFADQLDLVSLDLADHRIGNAAFQIFLGLAGGIGVA